MSEVGLNPQCDHLYSLNKDRFKQDDDERKVEPAEMEILETRLASVDDYSVDDKSSEFGIYTANTWVPDHTKSTESFADTTTTVSLDDSSFVISEDLRQYYIKQSKLLPKIRGVWFNSTVRRMGWVGQAYKKCKRIEKIFSINKHGFEGARQMAIAFRNSQKPTLKNKDSYFEERPEIRERLVKPARPSNKDAGHVFYTDGMDLKFNKGPYCYYQKVPTNPHPQTYPAYINNKNISYFNSSVSSYNHPAPPFNGMPFIQPPMRYQSTLPHQIPFPPPSTLPALREAIKPISELVFNTAPFDVKCDMEDEEPEEEIKIDELISGYKSDITTGEKVIRDHTCKEALIFILYELEALIELDIPVPPISKDVCRKGIQYHINFLEGAKEEKDILPYLNTLGSYICKGIMPTDMAFAELYSLVHTFSYCSPLQLDFDSSHNTESFADISDKFTNIIDHVNIKKGSIIAN